MKKGGFFFGKLQRVIRKAKQRRRQKKDALLLEIISKKDLAEYAGLIVRNPKDQADAIKSRKRKMEIILRNTLKVIEKKGNPVESTLASINNREVIDSIITTIIKLEERQASLATYNRKKEEDMGYRRILEERPSTFTSTRHFEQFLELYYRVGSIVIQESNLMLR